MRIGIHPVYFDIVQAAALGIGQITPPLGGGLRIALQFTGRSVGSHARVYAPNLVALAGPMLIVCTPELLLFLPRRAGLIQ